MAEEWQNPDTVKATVEIEKELYERVKRAFYYGQMTKLLRMLYESLDVMIKDGKIMEVVKFLQKEQALMIEPVKGDD